jgi:5'-methylthioadenosine phosphorylase
MPGTFFGSKIAIIGGGNLFDLDILNSANLREITTPYGRVNYYLIQNHVVINRHGPEKNIPPHQINHRANISALKKLGVKYVFSFNSVGSLRREIEPGQFVIPDDYIDFDPVTFFDAELEFVTPVISQKLRRILVEILTELQLDFHRRGIYYQTKGPRLETKAEIKVIKNFATVVGMTMAKEATLAEEIGLEYASLCLVDNFAHGLAKKTLTQQEIKRKQKESAKSLNQIITEILNLELK